MRNSKLLFLFILLVIGCKKENVPVTNETPVFKAWLLDSVQFSTNDLLLTSTAVNDSILAVANSSVIYHVNVNQLNNPIEGSFLGTTGAYDRYAQPTLNSQIGVALIDSHHVKIFSVLPPFSDRGALIYTPNYTSAVYSHKTYPVVYPSGSGYPVINSKFILTPDELDYEANKVYISLLEVSQSSPGNTQQNTINLISKKPIVLTPEESTLGFSDGTYFSAAYYGKFFLHYANQFYRIDTLGNVKKFGYRPVLGIGNGGVAQMFKLDNYLFTVSLDDWFVSHDEGETWSLYLKAFGTIYPSLKFINVGNELYATNGSQIWRVTLSAENLNYQELDNTGLTDNTQITSINKVGKYAFLTTLSGLYYRDTASFNAIKK